MSDIKCDENVFNYGEVHGVFDMPKAYAEEYCSRLTRETGVVHDWHYFGGRVVVKFIPEKIQELLDRITELEEKLSK